MKENSFFWKMFENLQIRQSKQLNMFRKKSLSDELCPICPSKVQNLAVFSINYMIRIRFFRAAGICTEGFRTHGTSITLVLLMTAILLSNQVWLEEECRILHRQGQEDEPWWRDKTTTGALSNEVESVPECSLFDQSEKCSRQRISILTHKLQCFHPW